jgi:hypothetical protein
MNNDHENKIKMSKKRLVLLYFADRQRHGNKELCDRFGWSWNQRKNLDLKHAGIIIDGEMINGNIAAWEYWLVTPNEEIDFEKCCLKSRINPPTPPPSAPAPTPTPPKSFPGSGEMVKSKIKIVVEKSGQLKFI